MNQYTKTMDKQLIEQVKASLSDYKIPIASLQYVNDADKLKVSNSQYITGILRQNWGSPMDAYECFYLVLLNRANLTNGIMRISQGGISGTVIDLRLIYCACLLSLSTNIIVAHNHPSGNKQPSQADFKVTEKLKKAGELLDIKLLDHIILTNDSYLSMADENLL